MTTTHRELTKNGPRGGEASGRRRELAALELLRSTGIDVLEAAQVACAVVARLRRKGYLSGCGEACACETQALGALEQSSHIIDLGIAALEQRENTCTLAEAGWASIEARRDCRKTTLRDLRYNFRRILRVEGAADMPLRAMTTSQCRRILQAAFGHSKSCYVKGRAMLSSVFSYGIRQEWCDSNPVSRIEVPRVEERTIEPLTPDMVEQLKQTAEQPEHRAMKLSLNLLLYSGIRPTEVSRLSDNDFCWEEGTVIIRPHKSKTGGGRVVPLRGISALPPQERHIPRGWQQRWYALRRAAGFTHWIPDVCRHTFASYYATHYKDLASLQLEMGHRDAALLRTRYVTPARRKQAAEFWRKAL